MGKGDRRPETLCGTHGGHRKDGNPCKRTCIPGTTRCKLHIGINLLTARSKGQVIVELAKWGLTDQTTDVDLDEVMLRLISQSAARVELYSMLLAQMFETADRLNMLDANVQADILDGIEGYGSDPDAERQRISADIKRILGPGGVGALIGLNYAATKDGDVYATGEAIRGLAQLEAQERDRCMTFVVKAKAAGLAERAVRVAEETAALLVSAVYGMLGELGLSREDPRVREVVAAKLRELASGSDGMTVEGELA